MNNNVLLEVQQLHKWFEMRKWGFFKVGEVKAVDGVDFEMKAGEAISVVGESGCGKSTLARTLLALQKPTKGKIFFSENDVDMNNKETMDWYRPQVGYVQQDPYGALPPFFTVKRILEEPMIINGIKDTTERNKRIWKSLTEMKLTPVEDFLYKFPHQLSGGQQQRVVLARARILNPKLLIADEPASMLDVSVRVEILQLIREIQEKYNLSVLYITHDLSTVRYFSERIFVMYGAKIIEKAPVESLLSTPKHPYTNSLLEAIPDPDAANAQSFREVPGGEPPSLLNPPSGCRFQPRCSKAIKGLCEEKEPPEIEIKDKHFVSCWLYTNGK